MDNSECITFDCFTKKQVREINKKVKENIRERQKPEQAAQNVNKIGDFFYVQCSSLMELLYPWLYQCQVINKNHFGYDIYWDFHLEQVSYNVYGENGEYGWHIDANPIQTPIDTKLTCLLNLSEETYEGGEFYLINQSEKIRLDSGMGIVFTSLIAHKVTPVTKGERISLTYWGYGPSWK